MKLIDPKDTPRAVLFDMFVNATQPTITLTKTMNITNVIRYSKAKHLSLNMLMMYCLGKAASSIKEVYMVPRKDGFHQYDNLTIETIIETRKGDFSFAFVPFVDDLTKFNELYTEITTDAYENGGIKMPDDSANICTSNIAGCEFDSVINAYNGMFADPFFAWGKYRKAFSLMGGYKFHKYTVPISLQVHHAMMDGGHVARMFNTAQQIMDEL